MSSCPGDVASHRSSDMSFSCRLPTPSGFAKHMGSSNLVGSLILDPFFRDLKCKMLGSLLL